MRIRTALKAGGTDGKIVLNHNETLAIRSALKAGGEHLNHSETLVSANHNEALRRASR